MLASIHFFTIVFAFLPCLALDEPRGRLPVTATIDTPFTIRVNAEFNLFLRFDEHAKSFEPFISRDQHRPQQFKLHQGNLTTVNERYTAIWLNPTHSDIYPPPANFLRFGHENPPQEAPFIALHSRSWVHGGAIETLYTMGHRET